MFRWLLVFFLANWTFLAWSTEPPSQKRMITLKEAIDRAIDESYVSRTTVESLYRAKHNVNIAINRLIPSLNFAAAYNLAKLGFVDAGIGAVGFFFPSNWFRWKESQLFFVAEKKSYAVILANQVFLVKCLFYKIQMFKIFIDIYSQYIDLLAEVIREVERRIPDYDTKEQPLRETIYYKILLEKDRISLEKALKSMQYELLIALGYNPDDFNTYDVEALKIPDLSKKSAKLSHDYLKDVYSRSRELGAAENLIKAAEYSTFARMFDFTLPSTGTDGSLGFGYSSNIKIGKSYVRELEVKKEEASAQLHLLLDNTINDYNWSLLQFKKNQEGTQTGHIYLAYLRKKLREKNYFDDNTVDAVNECITSDLGIVQAQHVFLIDKAQLKRLLWQEEAYAMILDMLRRKSPDKMYSLMKNMENHKIHKAIRHKKLAKKYLQV